MTTIGASAMTLADWAKMIDPQGRVAKIINVLSQRNEILDDMLFKEGNLPTGHQISQLTGLPTIYWKIINQGTPTSKATHAQVVEHCGIMEAWQSIDQVVAELGGNVAGVRASRALTFMDALNIEAASTLFYGSSANPEEFVGFAPRYSAISGATNGQNIIDAGGTGSDNASIWLVGWGENSIHGIFPKGSKAGIVHEDLGLVTVQTTAAAQPSQMRAYQDHWTWTLGLAVEDWRYAIRIANIDISDLVAENASMANLIKCMSLALDRFPTWAGIRPAFYGNRTVISRLRLQALDKSQNAIGAIQALDQFGNPRIGYNFGGAVPLRICDALLENEARVV